MAFASAAALAVESTNIVGYMEMQSATFQLITPMFTQVGGGTSFTLADLLPEDVNAWQPGVDKILLYTGAKKDYDATYVSEALVAEIVDNFPNLAGITAGWYNNDDFNALGTEETAVLRCYNSRAINYGASGFAIQSAAAVRFIGEVKTTGVELQSATFKLIGNCTPKDLTLAEILPVDISAWQPGVDKILLYTGAKKDYDATYVSEALVAEIVDNFPNLAGITAGWYNNDDFNALGTEETAVLRCYNSRLIPAGSGFAIQSSTAIVIPEP